MPSNMRLPGFHSNLEKKMIFFQGTVDAKKYAAWDLQPNFVISFFGRKMCGWGFTTWFFHYFFERAYWIFERVWAKLHKYDHFLGHRLEWPIVPDLFFEHLSAFGQNFISMAISLGIVWNGLLSQTYCVRAFWIANCPGLIEETRLKKQNFPDLFGSRVLSSKL